MVSRKQRIEKSYCKEHGQEHCEKNRAIIIEKAAAKITCELCGTMVCKNWIGEHKRTDKCKSLNLETKAEIVEWLCNLKLRNLISSYSNVWVGGA